MSESDQHIVIGPKQDTGENVAISSTSITKLKNKGTRRGSKNSESGSDVREAWKPRCMWFCLKCKPKIEQNILNEKERCEMYFKTMNTRFEAIEKKLDAKCDSKEVKEIVRPTNHPK